MPSKIRQTQKNFPHFLSSAEYGGIWGLVAVQVCGRDVT